MRRGRAGHRRSGLNRVGGLVNDSMDVLGLRHKIMEHQAIAAWDEVVGPQIAAASAVERIRDGVLFVCCKSSMWSNELSLHKQGIIKKLNSCVGAKVVADIRFSARGFASARRLALEEEGAEETKGLRGIDLPESELAAASKLASAAPTDDLAERIARAVSTSKRLKEWKIREGWRPCRVCGELHEGDFDVCDNCR